jgi:hypothetical protein
MITLLLLNVDCLLAQYRQYLVLKGYDAGAGSRLVAAPLHVWAEVRGHTPRARRSIKGGAKQVLLRTRPSAPWPALMAIVGATLHRGSTGMARAMVIQFTCYRRPGKLLVLHPQCLAPPMPLVSKQVSRRGLVLRPPVHGRAAKPGEFDESFLLDRPDLSFLNPYLGVFRRRARGTPVLLFDQNQYSKRLTATARQLALHDVNIDSYGLRHGVRRTAGSPREEASQWSNSGDAGGAMLHSDVTWGRPSCYDR